LNVTKKWGRITKQGWRDPLAKSIWNSGTILRLLKWRCRSRRRTNSVFTRRTRTI